MKKALAARGVGWFFPMKTGILPQAPGKKIACTIFEIMYANFPLACAIFQFGRQFCIGLALPSRPVGVDYSSSL